MTEIAVQANAGEAEGARSCNAAIGSADAATMAVTPAGLKGMSEGGVMGSIGALSNAISDALSQFGVVAEDQPFTPDRLTSWITNHRSGTHRPVR